MDNGEQRRPSADLMAGMAEEFMSDWTSDIFRARCVAQIESVLTTANQHMVSDDPVEQFLSDKSALDLEKFVFDKSKTRDDYMLLVAEIIMTLRKRAGRPAVNSEVLKNVSPEMLAQVEAHANGSLNGASSHPPQGGASGI